MSLTEHQELFPLVAASLSILALLCKHMTRFAHRRYLQRGTSAGGEAIQERSGDVVIIVAVQCSCGLAEISARDTGDLC